MMDFLWVKNIKEYPNYYLEIFGNKEISKSLGICVHHTDCEEWLLAVQDNVLLGFSGYEKNSVALVLKRSYVFPKYRGFGIYKKMLDMRISKAKELGFNMVQATTTQMSKREFEKRDFFTTKTYKQYQTWRKMI